MTDLTVVLRRPTAPQAAFIDSPAKRKVIKAGRRSGKTTGVSTLAVKTFLDGHRVLYGTPTQDQIDRFWYEVKRALEPALDAGVYYKNETRHIIERSGTENRIRAKTAWDADSLRGDYADLLILDEWQLMAENTWEYVGVPMLLDNNGDAVFSFTPPSPRNMSVSKARDPLHAVKLYKRARQDDSGRWQAFHFTSLDNPYLSREGLDEITRDMTPMAYKIEILAEDLEETPGALWSARILEAARVNSHPDLHRIIVGVDPAASTGQTGIVVCGAARVDDVEHYYTLDDATAEEGAQPSAWANQAIAAYNRWHADLIVGEVNNGGNMVENTLRTVDGGEGVNYKTVRATRGKAVRAEPISALFNPAEEHHPRRGHIVGYHKELEEELKTWVPGMDSPNRLDAMVWAMTELSGGGIAPSMGDISDLGRIDDFESKWTIGGS